MADSRVKVEEGLMPGVVFDEMCQQYVVGQRVASVHATQRGVLIRFTSGYDLFFQAPTNVALVKYSEPTLEQMPTGSVQ